MRIIFHDGQRKMNGHCINGNINKIELVYFQPQHVNLRRQQKANNLVIERRIRPF